MKTYFKSTTAKIIGVVCLAIMTMSSCQKDIDPIVYGSAKVKLVNASAGSGSQDFYQGDSKISTSSLAYGESSNTYMSIKAGNSLISFRNSGSGTISASDNLGVDTDDSFTAFYVANSTGGGQIAKVLDDNSAAPSGKARVRFINLGSIFSDKVSVKNSIAVILSDPLAYGDAVTVLVDVNVDLRAYVVGSANVTPISGTLFQSGKVYTVWLDAENSSSVQYHIIQYN